MPLLSKGWLLSKWQPALCAPEGGEEAGEEASLGELCKVSLVFGELEARVGEKALGPPFSFHHLSHVGGDPVEQSSLQVQAGPTLTPDTLRLEVSPRSGPVGLRGTRSRGRLGALCTAGHSRLLVLGAQSRGCVWGIHIESS